MSYGQLDENGNFLREIGFGNIEWDENNFCTVEALIRDGKGDEFNIVPLMPSEKPTYNRNTHSCIRDGAECVENQWQWKWVIAPLTSEVIAEQLRIAKENKYNEITSCRIAANEVSFSFGGKHISTSLTSKLDILFMNGEILNNGGFPTKWVGGWKAIDNSIVPITSLAAWKTFYSACVDQGLSNFLYSEQLKLSVKNATTLEQVESVNW